MLPFLMLFLMIVVFIKYICIDVGFTESDVSDLLLLFVTKVLYIHVKDGYSH